MTNEQLVSKIQAGDDVTSNMQQLWQQNKGFIYKIAARFRAYDDIEDLTQEGYFGLCSAVDGYDPGKGASFLSYAGFWIKLRIQRYIENNGSLVRIPSGTRGKISKYKRLCMNYEKQYGERPTDRQICYCMDISEEMLDHIKKAAEMGQIASLDSPVKGTEDGELTVGDTVAGTDNIEDTVLDEVQHDQLKAAVWPLVDALQGRQAEVIRAKFQEGKSLKEIGQQIGATPERARQHQNQALRELRRSGRVKKLQPFMEEYISTHAFRGCGAGTYGRTWTSATERTVLELLEIREENERKRREWIEERRREYLQMG